MLDAAKRARSNDLARIALPALDGELLQRAGAVTATPSGPEQPFEVVTLPQIDRHRRSAPHTPAESVPTPIRGGSPEGTQALSLQCARSARRALDTSPIPGLLDVMAEAVADRNPRQPPWLVSPTQTLVARLNACTCQSRFSMHIPSPPLYRKPSRSACPSRGNPASAPTYGERGLLP